MTSTLQLKLTYLFQLINAILIPIMALIVAVVLSIVTGIFVTIITFGFADDPFSGGDVSNLIVTVGFIIGLLYLIDTIGLIKKSNIARWGGILLNLAMSIFFISGIIDGIAETTVSELLPVFLLLLLYIFPLYTLLLHDGTKRLF